MNASTTVVGQEAFFQTQYAKIQNGALLFLDIGPGKIGKDDKEYLGFSPIKPLKYGGATFKRKELPILIFRITNPENFNPEITGERWKARVEKIEVTSQLTNNKQFQRVLVHIFVIERVENSFQFYDKKTKQYIVGTRSGRVTISQNSFSTEEEPVEYRDQQRGEQMAMRVYNVYAQVNGTTRELVSQTLVGAASKSILVKERASEIAQEALKKGKHGDNKNFIERAKKEVEEYFAGLPEMPKKLKELK